jgi:hypothetical protein
MIRSARRNILIALSLCGLLALAAVAAPAQPPRAVGDPASAADLAPVSFATAQEVRIRADPPALAAGKFNGGRFADLAVANQTKAPAKTGTVSILRIGSDGNLHLLHTVVAAPFLWRIAVADLNHDGRLDLITTADEGYDHVATLSVLLGRGNGTFGSRHDYRLGVIPYGVRPNAIAVGDLNRDGKLDVVVSRLYKVAVFLGKGDGTLGPMRTFASDPAGLSGDGAIDSLASGDINHDGKLDLVASCEEGVNQPVGILSVMLGKGDGTFRAAVTHSTSYLLPSSVALANLNQDGKLDLIVNNDADAEDWGVGSGTNWAAVVVSLGNGDGTFTNTAEYDLSELGSGAMKVADFNRDGHLDLAVVQNSSFDVLLGNGDGTFQGPATFAHSPQWSGDAVAAVGDFNGDGRRDLAVADGKTASIFFNRSN